MSKGPSVWEVRQDPNKLMWVSCNDACRIWHEDIDVVESYLAKWIEPNDILRLKGFTENMVELKAEFFLKEYYGSIETVPRDRKR